MINEQIIKTKNIDNNQNNICENFSDKVGEQEIEKKLFDLKKLTSILKNSKLANVKGIKIVGLILIICVGIMLFFKFSKSVDTVATNVNVDSQYNFTNSSAYAENLEKKLMAVLSNISGAGNVSVMVTLETSPEIILANSTDEKVNSSTSNSNSTSYTTTVTEPIIISTKGENSVLVVKEVLPEIKGVVVVATGAKNTNVKLNIVQAVKALLDIDMDNIQVFAGV